MRIDREARAVHCNDGAIVHYKRLLLATGSRVRRFAGEVDAGVAVLYVRTVADAKALQAVLEPGRRVAVLGGGFIWLEVAASATLRGCKVTVLDLAGRLLLRSMPCVVGEFLRALHARRGVDVRLNTMPIALRSTEGKTTIETDRGKIEADIIVISIGVLPNVELADQAGLEVDKGIVVDQHCRTSDRNVYAAGEVPMHFKPMLGNRLRVESWQIAENQPAIAAANMASGDQSYSEIPWL